LIETEINPIDKTAAQRYRMFCDEARLHGIRVPENGAHITFVLPMPQSWSKRHS
jgi:hypothetical protein